MVPIVNRSTSGCQFQNTIVGIESESLTKTSTLENIHAAADTKRFFVGVDLEYLKVLLLYRHIFTT